MAFSIRRLTDHFGAEILNLDCSKGGADRIRGDLLAAFHQFQLLLFRDQSLTPESQITFSRLFGDLAIHVLDQYLLPGNPEILVISNVMLEDGTTEGLDEDGVLEWHSDFFWREQPSIGSLLYALAAPPSGGDTLFASMSYAWERLADEMKELLGGLRARRSLEYLTENERKLNPCKPSLTEMQKRAAPPVVHPLVRTHPVTGQKSLFISQMAIEEIYGLEESTKEELLDKLFQHSTRPDVVYRHQWKRGDLLAWDNRCTIHTVTPSDRQFKRILHRTTLKGELVL